MSKKNYAFFMAEPGNEFSTAALYGASKAALELDANLYVFPSGIIDADFWDKRATSFRYQYNTLNSFFQSKTIDGVVIEYGTIVSDLEEDKKREFLSMVGDKPVVLLAEDAEGFESVCFDNTSGLRDAISHMIEHHGYKKIGFVSGAKDNHDAQERLSVYKSVMTEHGLYFDDTYITYGNFSPYSKDAVRELLENHRDLDAIAFANDDMALCGYEVLEEYNLTVGKDIFVTGFDDVPSAAIVTPQLSTIKADPGKLAYKAVMHLAGKSDLENVLTRFVIRQSCGCKSKALYDQDGDVLGTESQSEFIDRTSDKIKDIENDKKFYDEMEFLMREVVFYQDSFNRWMDVVLKCFDRLGFKKSIFLFYDEPIVYRYGEVWNQPSYLNLRAYGKGLDFHFYEPGEKVIEVKSMFENEMIAAMDRQNLMITPLFYHEKQLGLLLLECPISSVKFAYQLASHVSNTLEMLDIHETNERIKKELAAANQAKSQFLANMSHEIRTPINAIMGMNEMILRESKEKEIAGYAEDIKGAAESLLSIVNDILDFSKIEANKMTLIPAEYNLYDMVSNTAKQMSFRIRSKDLKLRLDIDENLPSKLVGDDNRIKQILVNLLSNGVKYTESGEVALIVTGEIQDDLANLHFSIKDTGIGIKKEDLAKLFEKFERLDENKNRNIEGTGLGMSITVGLLELMNTSLNVESVYGEGSEFSFDLRQQIADKTPISEYKKGKKVNKVEKHTQKFRAPEARILLVDDNEVNRLVVKRLLKKSGIIIDEADNGVKCLEKCEENVYDLVLLDHMMPVMDGMEALKKLKEMPNFDPDVTKVIALTANAIVGVDKEYLDAGFDAYLSKPILPNKLDEALMTFLPDEKIIMSEL